MNGKKFGGRTSSQISIYDYPEHLNPFYEDEQHKRLRFWKIGRKSDGKVKRSNSFSLDGIRELWTLKSFRLRKKSSTLGINKTSESPPPLRRTLMVEEHDPDRVYHTLDPSSRHTVSVGLNNSFQRSARYRSSLQDMSSFQQNSAFSRTDKYRNTMQNGQDFVHRGGSKTPQLSSRYSDNHIAHSSSQQSLNSTNPFEDEENQASASGSAASGSAKKPVRKKRRAPPPPTPKITVETVEKDDQKPVEAVAISNLTAEIESFVKSSEASEAVEEEAKESAEMAIPVPVPRREKREAPKFQVTKAQEESDIVLRITESIDDLTSESPAKVEAVEVVEKKPDVPEEKSEEVTVEKVQDKSDPYKNVVVEMEKYEIRFAPLKTNDDLGEENHRRNPIERQRSVQEIIDSINKNQSLLKINYEDDSRVRSIMKDIESQKMDVQRRKSSDSLNRNIQELELKEREMRELIRELEEASDIPVVVQEFNNNSFDKCVQLRDPERDQNDNQTVQKSSIEWNPLPKPRRSRNLSGEDVDVPPT
ncbi:uncharacterized protein LOC132262937 [Phlebotomus argentipes]|uniref:uncharacterized protein LOC132262937 n=1 Tax=Phlebotomus argentipes TaxID=94469 RepID=UPI002892A14D|nr:uncharacterized protein LOC132262937 [Phlebotomus argentipes]XP_059618427.1 uncharacterized protein LOC132262937 [Phlebotomus argentipes]XP_059618428.1 uncharacterized protein LOC132262937 [Phlebotomus argentipes]